MEILIKDQADASHDKQRLLQAKKPFFNFLPNGETFFFYDRYRFQMGFEPAQLDHPILSKVRKIDKTVYVRT